MGRPLSNGELSPNEPGRKTGFLRYAPSPEEPPHPSTSVIQLATHTGSERSAAASAFEVPFSEKEVPTIHDMLIAAYRFCVLY